MKRIRVSKIDQMIDLLESIERGQGSEWYRRQAIDYLKVYSDSLGDAKTLKVKEGEDEAESAQADT